MSDKKTPSEDPRGDVDVTGLEPKQKQLIKSSIKARFSAFLKPGERLEIDAERSIEYVWGQIRLFSADESYEFLLEGAIIASDQDNKEPIHAEDRALDVAFEFLKRQFYEFFRSDRSETFHKQWKLYPVDEATIRFRAIERRPDLEQRADEILDDPE